MPVAIHSYKPPVGLEVGSGGTAKTVGMHGGGLSIDIDVDGSYTEGRKRWEDGLAESEKEAAIERERAVRWYYAPILMHGDPSAKEDSMAQFDDAIQQLTRAGWQVVEKRIMNDMALTRGEVAMWAELKKLKTRQEQEL